MAGTRTFELGDILSITTGILVSSRHVQGVYDILNYMTGDNLFTHQLPRAARECTPELLKQHPQLGEIDSSNVGTDNWREWLAEQEKRFGKALPVSPIHNHVAIDPVQEMVDLVGEDRVIIAPMDETD